MNRIYLRLDNTQYKRITRGMDMAKPIAPQIVDKLLQADAPDAFAKHLVDLSRVERKINDGWDNVISLLQVIVSRAEEQGQTLEKLRATFNTNVDLLEGHHKEMRGAAKDIARTKQVVEHLQDCLIEDDGDDDGDVLILHITKEKVPILARFLKQVEDDGLVRTLLPAEREPTAKALAALIAALKAGIGGGS